MSISKKIVMMREAGMTMDRIRDELNTQGVKFAEGTLYRRFKYGTLERPYYKGWDRD